jgi:hypothetical protein
MRAFRTARSQGVGRLVAMGLVLPIALVVVGWGGASAAFASFYSLTGTNSNAQFMSPDSLTREVTVHAYGPGDGGFAFGSLETSGRDLSPGNFSDFSGHVTCMKVIRLHHGRFDVIVGAFGTVSPEALPTLPGKYAEILTVEIGSFTSLTGPASDTFGLIGANGEGLPSAWPPSCKRASFASQIVPPLPADGVIQLRQF